MYFLYFEFRVASVFLFSFSGSESSLLKIKIIFALLWRKCCSACWICPRLSTITRRVSVELISDLLWLGKDGVSMIWIGVSSNLNVPSCGSRVVNGKGDILGFRFVRVLKIVDLPVFGNPTRTHCISAFLIP